MTSDLRLVAGAILRSDFYSFVQAIFPIVSPNGAFRVLAGFCSPGAAG